MSVPAQPRATFDVIGQGFCAANGTNEERTGFVWEENG